MSEQEIENAFEEDDGVATSFVELPVDCAWVKWTRGNGQLAALRDTDPGQYFGGWKSRVVKFGGKDGELNPVLPYPIVERSTQDASATFDVYATNVLHVVIIASRERFELREEVMDEKLGFKVNKVRKVALKRQEGFKPNKQILGWAFNPTTEEHEPVLIVLDAWNAYISFNNASTAWKKATKNVAPGMSVIRRYGSVGKAGKDGKVLPVFEKFGEGTSTPIEAIDIAHPRLFKVTPELLALQTASQAWKTDPRWLQEGKIGQVTEENDNLSVESDAANPWLERFAKRAKELKYTDQDIADELAHAGGDYRKAYEAIADQSQLASVDGAVNMEPPF